MFPLQGSQVWLLALLLGPVTGLATYFGTKKSLRDIDQPPGRWPVWFGLAGGILGTLFILTTLAWGWQATEDVLPRDGWRELRAVFHLSLITLLLMITATDLRSYYILDWTCWLGVCIGLLGAVISGDFQLMHVWIDWNQEIPQLAGPYRPAWLSAHPHWHGLAWSAAGILTGVSLTQLVRSLSRFVLAQPALGLGDVYLMAMVGAYLGWQATLIVLLIAPVLALVIGGFLKLTTNRPALPYGPFLALGTLLVLFFWRALWMAEFSLSAAGGNDRMTVFALRRFFGDPVALLGMFGGSLVLLIVLLSLLRLYKSLPLKR